MTRSYTSSDGNAAVSQEGPRTPSDRLNLHDVATYVAVGLSVLVVLITLFMWSQVMSSLTEIQLQSENYTQQINAIKSSIPSSPADEIGSLKSQVSKLSEDIEKNFDHIPNPNQELATIDERLTKISESLSQMKELIPKVGSSNESP